MQKLDEYDERRAQKLNMIIQQNPLQPPFFLTRRRYAIMLTTAANKSKILTIEEVLPFFNCNNQTWRLALTIAAVLPYFFI